MTEQTQKPGPDPKTLLHLSSQFLRRRHFSDCRKYAHQAHQLNSSLAGVTKILAVADVLLTTTYETPNGNVRDWYEVLQVDRYSQNLNLINKQYGRLYGLLNPCENTFPFADEAFEIVCDAWGVLSHSEKKFEYDCMVKKILEGEQFWTVCPYCYYLYEYPRVYLEGCVRCVNEKCGKAFTCVEIDRPPDEVLGVGGYVCDGFVMLGLKTGCWNPFKPVHKKKPDCGTGVRVDDKYVEISDDDDEDEDVDVDGGCVNGGVKVEGGGVTVEPMGANVGRKKSAARNTKKVTGVGNRSRKEAFVEPEESEDYGFEVMENIYVMSWWFLLLLH
ncbi:putative DnaJ domain, Chaperone J-domain superfamily [Helianthus annuus]|uniref:DnaJ domain, Chaperone J-domain superfamily n=1 Tax=Helianthus annuus TaxID=4232 RepID=A0A9K3IL19_HELAN|nr:putative DnaJ domain, Chaperone J-domain superfamily [Helianthus annuus]KAJ0549992.1 putative DnaJ domain, Chaperone J-domain superfamily [Helianthus annuus]KAJ0562952.1 putative DnaJ domain, Chaperone J-domain superfamily [Helianthus annuus]KAJ0728317.1 putative DnaJ domain, Chaperone J-domain superfamily [Helianthus annuus]KAJ0731086.1 putative DnaJ domain, Chaperone J-domain superfamily [Helianthus annuus]